MEKIKEYASIIVVIICIIMMMFSTINTLSNTDDLPTKATSTENGFYYTYNWMCVIMTEGGFYNVHTRK